MRRPRLTVRVRLTLLYTLLFAVSGSALIAVTYFLLAAGLPRPAARDEPPLEFVDACTRVLRGEPTSDTNLVAKCRKAYEEGLIAGARSQRDATLDALLWQSGLSLAAVTLLSAGAGWFVAGRVLRPVHRLTAAARAAAGDDLTARVALGGPRDELRELADTFDTMLDRLQHTFEAQRRFIANASHELRTPLTVMRTTVDVVLAKPHATGAELRGMAGDVRAAVDRAETLIEALLTLARNDGGLIVCEPTDLATIAEDAVDTVKVGDRTLHLALEPAPATGDPVLLERLACNLLDNAVRHNAPAGDIWLTTSTVDDRVFLTIANHGPLINPAAAGELFQPFRRLHERTGTDGFGLGLAIVDSIARAHDGTVTALPLETGGLRITVTLPRRRD